jgi:hypothetical protein
MSIASTPTPPLAMPQPMSYYDAENGANKWALLADARAAAADAGFDPASYDMDCVHALLPHVISQAAVGGKGIWLTSTDAGALCHEIGHNLGFWHANAWRTTDQSVTGAGQNMEYDDHFDIMGYQFADLPPFNTWAKHRLGWLPDAAVATPTQPGVYYLRAQDLPTLVDGPPMALRIPADSQRDYWIETRRGSADLQIRWSPWSLSAGGTQLLDTTPDSEGRRWDAPLKPGQSFHDPASGFTVRNLGPAAPDTIGIQLGFGTDAASEPVPTQMTAVRDSGGAITLILTGEPGRRCVVEASTDWVRWEPIGETILAALPVRVTDGEAVTNPLRWYRAIALDK